MAEQDQADRQGENKGLVLGCVVAGQVDHQLADDQKVIAESFSLCDRHFGGKSGERKVHQSWINAD